MPTAAPCSVRPRRPAPPSLPCRPPCRWSTRCRCSEAARPTTSPPPRSPASLPARRRSAKLRSVRRIAVAPANLGCGGVVLLHGIAMGSWTLKKLERALQPRGYATLNLDYASRKKPLQQLAEDIHVSVDAF